MATIGKSFFKDGVDFHIVKLYFDGTGENWWDAKCIGANWVSDAAMPKDSPQPWSTFTGDYMTNSFAEIPVLMNPIGHAAWEINDVGNLLD